MASNNRSENDLKSENDRYIVDCCLKSLGFYNFLRGFRWAYKQRDLHPRVGVLIGGNKKLCEN